MHFWLKLKCIFASSLDAFWLIRANMSADAEGRRAKLRRSDAFRRRNPYVSASALSALLDDVEQNGIPELHTEKACYEASEGVINEDTDYGRLSKRWI